MTKGNSAAIVPASPHAMMALPAVGNLDAYIAAGHRLPMLSAEQETLVVQVLALKLEGARVALLRGDTTSFRDLCESASHWLDTYFQGDDPGVAAAHAELERLQPLDLSPPLPDISRSLGLLRAFMKQPEPASATP